MSLPTKVAEKTAKFHLEKAFQLEKQYQQIESVARRKIIELENELKEKLVNIKKQIDGHRSIATTLSQPQ